MWEWGTKLWGILFRMWIMGESIHHCRTRAYHAAGLDRFKRKAVEKSETTFLSHGEDRCENVER